LLALLEAIVQAGWPAVKRAKRPVAGAGNLA